MAKREKQRTLWPTEAAVGDVVGRLIQFWGFKRNMGRVWTVLYLSPDPLSAEDLRNALGLSSGAVDAICQRARDELGAGPGTCATAPIFITCDRAGAPCGNETSAALLFQNGAAGDGGRTDGRGGADVSVTVSYQVSLLSTYLVSRVFDLNPVTLSATASFGGLGE